PTTHILSLHDALPIYAIPGIQSVHEVWSVIALFFRGLIAPRLLLAEVGFVNKRANFSLAQKIPAFIYGDLVQPGGESRALIEFRSEEHTSELQSPYDL